MQIFDKLRKYFSKPETVQEPTVERKVFIEIRYYFDLHNRRTGKITVYIPSVGGDSLHPKLKPKYVDKNEVIFDINLVHNWGQYGTGL